MKDRIYETARDCNYDGYERTLASMVYNLFDKKTGSGVSVKELTEKLHKSVIKKFRRKKVHARFKDNISAADLTEIKPLKMLNYFYMCRCFH